jgi:hypothetical protein
MVRSDVSMLLCSVKTGCPGGGVFGEKDNGTKGVISLQGRMYLRTFTQSHKGNMLRRKGLQGGTQYFCE